MELKPLRLKGGIPGMSDYVVHMTKRKGATNSDLPEDIARMSGAERLISILETCEILGFPTFGVLDPVVCFSEASPDAISHLIRVGRYEPFGIAFSKDVALKHGGGPAFYVRGDEMEHLRHVPPQLRFRFTRFWPGAVADSGEQLDDNIANESNWAEEREWRLLVDDSRRWRFALHEIAFLIVPETSVAKWMADRYEEDAFLTLPEVSLNNRGDVLADPAGVWH